VHDLAHEAGTTATTGAGTAILRDLGTRVSAALNAGSDFSLGDTVAVADDHSRRK
jgi:hypothetical protein